MALPQVDQAFYPTEAEIRDQILRTIRVAFLSRGIKVNTLPGSDYFISATALARVISIAFANSKVALRDVSPLTATGDNLRKICAAFGVYPRPASSASGPAVVKCTGTIVLPGGYSCTAPNGKKYKTVASLTLTTGAQATIQATDAGADTNQPAGTILSWDSASVGALAPTATVGPGGLTGGDDGDDDESLRTRLLERLSSPGVGGNWAAVKGWAEAASAAVGAAYVYQAVRGPGSVDVALVSSGKDPQLGASTVAQVAAIVAANIPGYASLNTTSVQKQPVDVTVAAKLPLPTFAGGTGGGWLDAAPWPTEDVKVFLVNLPSTIRVTGSTKPALGQHFSLWDPGSQAMTDFQIITPPPIGVPNDWILHIAPVNGGTVPLWVVPGLYVSASAQNLADYATDLLAEFNALGPGEKTANTNIIPRALRKPSPDVVAPTDLSSVLLAAVTNKHPEILSLDWGARYVAGTTTPITTPPLPVTTADPPFVLTLNNLAIRAAA